MNPKARLAAKIGAVAAAAAAAFVATHEGTVLRTYRDPIGIVTACAGHVDASLKMGATYTPAQCQEMLYVDLVKHAGDLDCVRVPLTDTQKVALLSFTFNVGARNFCGSTLVQKANAGAQPLEWCAELKRWVFANNVRLQGLVSRRQAEYELCVS